MSCPQRLAVAMVTALLTTIGVMGAPANVGIAQAAPANDSFPGPMLAGYGVSVAGDNVGATKQYGEPEGYNPDQIQHSVWYSWTAPNWSRPQQVRLAVNNADFDTEVEVFDGDIIFWLFSSANDDDAGSTTNESQVVFSATPNNTYRIQIDGWGGAQGSFVLSIGDPDNSTYCSLWDWTFPYQTCIEYRDIPNTFPGFALTGVIGTAKANNANASGEAGEPGDPVAYSADASLWYSWTPPESGTARIVARGIDTTIGVFTGDAVTSLVPAGANNDYGGSTESLVDVAVTAGQTYRIQLDGGGVNVRGNINLSFVVDPAANDLFASPEAIGRRSGNLTRTIQRALTEPGDPSPHSSVWYAFTAPRDGTVGFESNAGFTVYEGSSITALTPVAEATYPTFTTFPTTQGTVYRIQVPAWGGGFFLRWNYALCEGRPATITSSGTITGTASDDVIVASSMADTIDGGDGSDWICGAGGNDVIQDGRGYDRVFGGAGRDTMIAPALVDQLDFYDGGDGVDTVSYQYRNSAVSVTLDNLNNDGSSGEVDRVVAENVIGGSAGDTLTGSAASETLGGRGGDDIVKGGDGADILLGGAGNDTLDGQSGDDIIRGVAGNDVLSGGLGNDSLYGGDGGDSMNVQDGVSGNDIADGGTGADIAQSDLGDVVTNL